MKCDAIIICLKLMLDSLQLIYFIVITVKQLDTFMYKLPSPNCNFHWTEPEGIPI